MFADVRIRTSSCLGARQERYALRYHACLVSCVNSHINKCLDMATSLTLNIEKYCYSCVNGLADLWCLRGRCLPIKHVKLCSKDKYRINLRTLNQIKQINA